MVAKWEGNYFDGKSAVSQKVEIQHVSEGILTAKGGMTSHAALVARGWGKSCVVGCSNLNIDLQIYWIYSHILVMVDVKPLLILSSHRSFIFLETK